jgi:hypothetical protein
MRKEEKSGGPLSALGTLANLALRVVSVTGMRRLRSRIESGIGTKAH